MNAPLALFRCDASPAIGGGHAMRCLTLAEALESGGWRTLFACAPGSEATVPALSAKARLAPDAAAGTRASLAVVDHYGLDARQERALRDRADRILVIDDLADRPHDCDVLLDQTVGRAATDYRALVPETCRLLLGADYALLRSDFARLRAQALARRGDGPVGRILLSFGASDPKGFGVGVARALLVRRDAPTIDLVVDAAGLDAARDLARAHPDRLTVHYRTADMAGLMLAADLAAGAAGTTSWERCALGLPSVAVVTADNQRLIAARLAEFGAADLVPETPPPGPDAIADRLMALCADGSRRAAISRAAAALADGRGTQRVRLALCGSVATRDGAKVELRAMERADLDEVLVWQTQDGQRRYARDPRPPTREGHARWFERQVADPDAILALVVENATPRGLLQLRRLDDARHEVSLLIDARAQGRGLGIAALLLARAAMPGVALEAEIHPDNAASLRVFARAGYRSEGARYLSRPDAAPAFPTQRRIER